MLLHGSQGCSTRNNMQCRFGSLATSTIASTCMTHLLLLWDERRNQVGSREEHMQGDTGRAMFSKGPTRNIAA
jgi:hypothetical protein